MFGIYEKLMNLGVPTNFILITFIVACCVLFLRSDGGVKYSDLLCYEILFYLNNSFKDLFGIGSVILEELISMIRCNVEERNILLGTNENLVSGSNMFLYVIGSIIAWSISYSSMCFIFGLTFLIFKVCFLPYDLFFANPLSKNSGLDASVLKNFEVCTKKCLLDKLHGYMSVDEVISAHNKCVNVCVEQI